MKRFLMSHARVLGVLCLNSSDKITLQNLQSISFETSGGFAGIKSSISIWPSSKSSKPGIMWKQTIGGRDTEYFNILSDADFNHLVSMLNAAKISQLNGKKFEQVGLYDGFNETLTVTLKDGRKFVVENYGDTAPAEYYAITRQLELMKPGAPSQK